jgi:hypothetical protein
MGETSAPNNNSAPTEPTTPEVPARPTLSVDYARYEKMLEEADISDAEKQEFLETLWNIIVAFVDLGFGVHPLQQAMDDACEQNKDLSGIDPLDVVSSKVFNKTNSNNKLPGAKLPVDT